MQTALVMHFEALTDAKSIYFLVAVAALLLAPSSSTSKNTFEIDNSDSKWPRINTRSRMIILDSFAIA